MAVGSWLAGEQPLPRLLGLHLTLYLRANALHHWWEVYKNEGLHVGIST